MVYYGVFSIFIWCGDYLSKNNKVKQTQKNQRNQNLSDFLIIIRF